MVILKIFCKLSKKIYRFVVLVNSKYVIKNVLYIYSHVIDFCLEFYLFSQCACAADSVPQQIKTGGCLYFIIHILDFYNLSVTYRI